jgi:hypothetical protein
MELLRGRKVLLLPASVEPPRIHRLNPGMVVCLNVELQGRSGDDERVRASTWDVAILQGAKWGRSGKKKGLKPEAGFCSFFERVNGFSAGDSQVVTTAVGNRSRLKIDRRRAAAEDAATARKIRPKLSHSMRACVGCLKLAVYRTRAEVIMKINVCKESVNH